MATEWRALFFPVTMPIAAIQIRPPWRPDLKLT